MRGLELMHGHSQGGKLLFNKDYYRVISSLCLTGSLDKSQKKIHPRFA